MIKANEDQFSVGLMCRMVSVSRSGYYDWRNRPYSNANQANQLLATEIKRIFNDEKGRPGSPRITQLLQSKRKVNQPVVTAWLELCATTAGERKRLRNKATTNSNHSLPVAPNLLKSVQNFTADAPDQKWVSDITYIWTDEGWLYLAVVLELYSRRVIGWAINERMTAALVCDALMMALWRHRMPKDVIVHSDRGSQYCSAAYQKLFNKHQLICSMSKKGDCYDNAAMESWNHSFKVEAIHGERFSTRSEAKYHVFEYIEVYYNRKRLHSKLGYVSPEAFEAKKVA
jgi:putative transposase